MTKYLPEGQLINTLENKNAIKSIFSLQEAMAQGKLIEARAKICDR